MTGTGYRDRLITFYTQYNPSCVNSVDAILSTYKDREEDLIKVLVAKYGPEPGNAGSSSSLSTGGGTSAGERASTRPLEALAMDSAHRSLSQPTRTETANAANTVAELVRRRQDAGGSTPSSSSQFHYDNTSTEALINSLVKKYAAPSNATSASIGQSFSRNDPPAPSQSYQAQPYQDNRSSSGAAMTSSSSSWRTRFLNFYDYYKPDALPHIEEKMMRHQGNEEAWMATLVQKYGPEPPPRRQQQHSPQPRVSAAVAAVGPLVSASLATDSMTTNMNNNANTAPRQAGGINTNNNSYFQQYANNNRRSWSTRTSSLKSPSPPSHPLHQPILAQRMQNPDDIYLSDVGTSASAPAAAAADVEVSDVISRLTNALDVKTRELITLKGTKKAHDEEVRHLQDRIKELEVENEAAVQKQKTPQPELAALKMERDELRKRVEALETLQSNFDESTAQWKAELERVSRSLALREHQSRLIRAQADQASAEVAMREKHISELSSSLKDLYQTNRDLVDENSALRLSLTEPSSEQKFYKVVAEIQETAQKTFEQRKKILEAEMQQYYEYAKLQVSQRDATIRLLTEQLTMVSAGLGAGGGPPVFSAFPSVSGGGESMSVNERALLEEVARLKLQLSVQTEEYKSFLSSQQQQRKTEIERPPNMGFDPAEFSREIHRLNRELKKTQEEAAAAKETLHAELRQQVEEMKDIHDRVEAYEAEKAQLLQTIAQLKDRNAREEPYTKSNMWSLLYDPRP